MTDCKDCGDDIFNEIVQARPEAETINYGSKLCCNKCGGKGCDSLVPQPFYGGTEARNAVRNVIVNRVPASVTSANDFNMPGCGLTGKVKLPQVIDVLLGTFLFSPEIGYLEFTGWDPAIREATVKNNCEQGNVAVGTEIPKCTKFMITDKSIATIDPNQTGNFLAVDFTAPAIGNCIDITVTGIAGLAQGGLIAIATGVYRVSAINGPEAIRICNDGAGASTGTPVYATATGSTDYITPIILVNTDACSAAQSETGLIMICADGRQTTLSGVLGGIPTVTDEDTGKVEIKLPGFPMRKCTQLISDLTLIASEDTYVLTLNDLTDFTVDTVFTLEGSDSIWTVTHVTDAHHITATVDPVPGAIANVETGTYACQLSCCDQLTAEVDALAETYVTRVSVPCLDLDLNFQDIAVDHTDTDNFNINTNSGHHQYLGTLQTVTITNNSECRNKIVHVTFQTHIYGEVSGGPGTFSFGFLDQPFRTAFGVSSDNPDSDPRSHDFSFSETNTFVVAPGDNIVITKRGVVNWISGADANYELDSMYTRISGIAFNVSA